MDIVIDFLKKLRVKRKNELTPNYDKPRPRCPFYGFHFFENNFYDQNGNQCPFITKRYAPCQMEINDEIPDWDKCRFFNTEENRVIVGEIFTKTRILPKEFQPEDGSDWVMIDWVSYIMNQSRIDYLLN